MEHVIVARGAHIEPELAEDVTCAVVAELEVLAVKERRLRIVGWKPVEDIGPPTELP
jgi:hypothetical protein